MDKGFTLFELLVVIAIIGILSSISLPNYLSWRNKAILSSAVFNVRSDLERARSVALRNNSEVRVVFSVNGYSVLVKAINSEGSEEWRNEFSRSLETVSFDMTKTSFDSQNYAVFNSRGMLTTIGGSIVMDLGSENGMVSVERTGRIRVS